MLQKSRTPAVGVANLLHTLRQFFQTWVAYQCVIPSAIL